MGNKEKKHLSDTMAKANEEMSVNQEKLDYLNGVKAKLEKTLDQMDSAVEKDKRKLEGELRMAQETVSDFERNKRELEQVIMRKDTEINQMVSRLDDEQSGMGRVQKSIK